MIGYIRIKERGATPRGMAKELNRIKKDTWRDTGIYFHRSMLPLRFTKRGGEMLRYAKRKGEGIPKSDPRYKRSYTGRKERKFGHTDPMVYTGESKGIARIRDVRSTSKGVKIVIGARKLNFRHPKSKIQMNVEIRRVTTQETNKLANEHDKNLDRRLKQIGTTKTTTV